MSKETNQSDDDAIEEIPSIDDAVEDLEPAAEEPPKKQQPKSASLSTGQAMASEFSKKFHVVQIFRRNIDMVQRKRAEQSVPPYLYLR